MNPKGFTPRRSLCILPCTIMDTGRVLPGQPMQRPVGDTEMSSEERDQLRELRAPASKGRGCARGPSISADFCQLATIGCTRPLSANSSNAIWNCEWRGGRPIYLEEYLKQFPELRSDTVLLTQLLFEEYRVRERHGNRPAWIEFGNASRNSSPRSSGGSTRKFITRMHSSRPIPSRRRFRGRPRSPHSRRCRAGTSSSSGSAAAASARCGKRKRTGGVEAAIKIIFRSLDHSEAKRELESLELMKRLRHPFLLQTQAFWSMEDRLLIAMELADGSLRDRLKVSVAGGQSGIPVEELLVYIREASEALDYLHSKQVLHRDIKPDNILLLGRHAKVADFGLARLLQSQMAQDDSHGHARLHGAGKLGGPGERRSDQYSLAGSYAELRLNRDLFERRDIAGMMIDHLEKIPDLEPLPRPEQEVLLKALSKEPAGRMPLVKNSGTRCARRLGQRACRSEFRIGRLRLQNPKRSRRRIRFRLRRRRHYRPISNSQRWMSAHYNRSPRCSENPYRVGFIAATPAPNGLRSGY